MTQSEHRCVSLRRFAPDSPDRARRPLVDFREHGVEAAQAGKARARGDFGHRQPRLVEQSLGTLHAHGARHLEWARADVSTEETVEVARTDAQSRGEVVDAPLIEGAFPDQPYRSMDGSARSLPGRRERRGLGPAAQAGPVAGDFGGGRGRIEADVLALRRTDGTDGSAIDARRAHAGEEAPVIVAVTFHTRAFAFKLVERDDGV